ncbi:MAG: hypothetical protein EOP24_26830 [Hyphomicrobiales bacterium]|nr:MAG: hypothetical protein EOP24_26830 [Hyphomicrobiales bacterium]
MQEVEAKAVFQQCLLQLGNEGGHHCDLENRSCALELQERVIASEEILLVRPDFKQPVLAN